MCGGLRPCCFAWDAELGRAPSGPRGQAKEAAEWHVGSPGARVSTEASRPRGAVDRPAALRSCPRGTKHQVEDRSAERSEKLLLPGKKNKRQRPCCKGSLAAGHRQERGRRLRSA